MARDLEARVRALENFRYGALGQINACRTMVLQAWLNILIKHAADPVAKVAEMQKLWKKGAESPPAFLGVDPVHLDAASQEYAAALESLTNELAQLVQGAVAK
jgi:hypothetical protein